MQLLLYPVYFDKQNLEPEVTISATKQYYIYLLHTSVMKMFTLLLNNLIFYVTMSINTFWVPIIQEVVECNLSNS